MKKIFLGVMATILLSGAAFAGGSPKVPVKKQETKKEASCTKDNCPNKNCTKTANCPNKPNCVCN